MALLNAANHGPEVLRLSAFAVCLIEAIWGFWHIWEQGQGAEVLPLPHSLCKVLLGLHHHQRNQGSQVGWGEKLQSCKLGEGWGVYRMQEKRLRAEPQRVRPCCLPSQDAPLPSSPPPHVQNTSTKAGFWGWAICPSTPGAAPGTGSTPSTQAGQAGQG